MRSFWIIQVGPKSNGKCFYKWCTDRHKGDSHVKTETEVEVTQPHAREPPGAGRGKEPILTQSLLMENGPANILISDLWPPEL